MKKTIRVLVTAMVEIVSDLEPDEAILEFEQECLYNFEDTTNVEVADSEWRDTKKISVLYESIK